MNTNQGRVMMQETIAPSPRPGRGWGAKGSVLLLAATLVGGAAPNALVGQSPDSVPASPQPLFSRTDAYYAAGFLAVAAAMAPIDLKVAHELRDSTAQANQLLEHSATGFRLLGNPGVLVITGGMYAAGRLVHRPELADVGLHATEAIGFAEVATVTIKTLVGRKRPYADPEHPYDFKLGRGFLNDSSSSFPSGHTTAAFATAAALSGELARIYPHEAWFVRPLLYGGAGLVGLSRLYNNDHWASDVVIAAAIGSFGGWKVVRFNHTHPHNRVDRWLLSARVMPSPGGGARISWSIASSY
jgi:membrane-associated phospholipid phosphatase